MRFICLLLGLFSFYVANGQADLISKKGTKYFYKDKQYSCEEMGTIYMDHQESLDLYISGRSKAKAGSTTSLVGLGIMLLGGGIASGGSIPRAIVGALGVLVGGVVALVGLVPLSIGNKRMKEAMRIYNYELIRQHGFGSDASLSFSQTVNGVGIVLSF